MPLGANVTGDAVRLLGIIQKHYGTPDQEMVGAEIGVHRGFLSAKLLETFPNLRLIMIDPWADLTQNKQYQETGDIMVACNQADQEGYMIEATKRTDFAKERRVIIRDTSVEAAKTLGSKLDWGFLDACHHYDSVKEDVEIWWPRIKDGGFFSGHDYGVSPRWGINRAVNELAGRTGLQIHLAGSCWWIAKP